MERLRFPCGNLRIYSGKSEVNKDVFDLEMRRQRGRAGSPESERQGKQQTWKVAEDITCEASELLHAVCV